VQLIKRKVQGLVNQPKNPKLISCLCKNSEIYSVGKQREREHNGQSADFDNRYFHQLPGQAVSMILTRAPLKTLGLTEERLTRARRRSRQFGQLVEEISQSGGMLSPKMFRVELVFRVMEK
jgi:hypothetical protein